MRLRHFTMTCEASRLPWVIPFLSALLYFEKDRPCAACQARKQVGTSNPSKNIMTTSIPLELLFGPVAYLSIGGSKYGLFIVDDYSRFTWIFFLQDKPKTQGTLNRFLRQAQNEFDLRLKKIRHDNGFEFKNPQVEEYIEEEGIKHEFFVPYTPHQNGVVERKNRTHIDMARTMLGDYKTPSSATPLTSAKGERGDMLAAIETRARGGRERPQPRKEGS
jgi:transposase InsO family protein